MFSSLEVARATEAEILNGVVRLEAGAESVAHEGGEISGVFRPLRTPAAKKFPARAGIAPRITSDHGAIEVCNPFPNEPMEVSNAPEICEAHAHCR